MGDAGAVERKGGNSDGAAHDAKRDEVCLRWVRRRKIHLRWCDAELRWNAMTVGGAFIGESGNAAEVPCLIRAGQPPLHGVTA